MPQQKTVPADVRPQAAQVPEMRSVNTGESLIATGTAERLTPPAPGGRMSAPQHHGLPSAARAQVCCPPTTIDLNLMPPVTSVGTVRLSPTVPIPSRRKLFATQKNAAPSAVSPQRWLLVPAARTRSFGWAGSATGDALHGAPAQSSVIAPSCPLPFDPQQ